MNWYELAMGILRSRKVQGIAATGLLVLAGWFGLDVTSEETMSWVLANWDAILGVAGGIYGLWQRRNAKAAKKVAAQTASDLDRIRTEAGTKGPSEG